MSQGLPLQEGRRWFCPGSVTTGDRYQDTQSCVSPGSAGVSTARGWRREAFRVGRQLYKVMWAHLTWGWGVNGAESLLLLQRRKTKQQTHYFFSFFYFSPAMNVDSHELLQWHKFWFSIKNSENTRRFNFINFSFKKPVWFCPIMFSFNWCILRTSEEKF